MGFAIDVVVTLIGILLSFYGFWGLAGRAAVAAMTCGGQTPHRPFACFVTDPFREPIARANRLPVRGLAAVALVGVASALTALPG